MKEWKVLTAKSVLAALSCVLAGRPVPALAHHSFSSAYKVEQTITLEGTVVQFLYRNPHSFVHLIAPDKGGKMVEWSVEWGAGPVLGADNIKADTLRPGDKVVVIGNPARGSDLHRLRMREIMRPADGWKWAGTFG